MRRARLAAAVLALAFPSIVAAAGDYSSLRAAHPAIDRAVAAMPSSSVHGDLNRLAALASSERTLEFLAGVSPGDEAPASLQRQWASALDHLASDLEWGLEGLSLRDTLVLAQVADILAVEPGVALLNGQLSLADCGSRDFECPDLEEAVATIVSTLEDAIRRDYAEAAAADPTLPSSLPDPTNVRPAAFGEWLDDVLTAPGLALTGVESIDDGER